MSWDDAKVDPVPAGTVTLLLADIEGSTRLWEERAGEMPQELERLDEIVDGLVGRHGGVRPIEMGEGDSFVAGFALASDAVACALDLQRATVDGVLRLRIGVHTGEVQQRKPNLYMGSTINRTARIRDAGHGGQVLLSQTTVEMVHDQLPEDCSLVDVGACRLRDVGRTVHLWQLAHPQLPATFPPLRGLDTWRNNLPVQLTSFVGRQAALRHLHESLELDRALTLTGAGGCGKTRLALQLAAERVDRYAGGTWLVDFAPVNDADAVEMLVADAIGAAPRGGDSAIPAVIDALGAGPALVVLDNCEHLVAECAALVETLLRACKELTVLATSREPLGFAGEVTFRVPSLTAPDRNAVATLETIGEFEAVALFEERARRARSRFCVDESNAGAVADICRRLDGIPLAIELAAARMRVLSPEQILEGLHDRFRLLTGGARTAVPRHQTLQASVEWSYALLLEPERTLLQRLSVFAGGFTLEAAEAVGSGGCLEPHHVFDLLMQLVDKSLVTADEEGANGRFGMLETVRQYAATRLIDSGDATDVRRRHYEFFVGFAVQQVETTSDYCRRIEPDYDNVRRALQWADDQSDPAELVRLTRRLYGYWALGRRVDEGHLWLRRAVDQAPTPEQRGRVLSHFAHVHGMTVSWEEAVPLAHEGVTLARATGRAGTLAWALSQLSNALANTWRTAEAEEALHEAIELAESSGDDHGHAFALFQLGRMLSLSDPHAALVSLTDADRVAEDVGAEYIQHMSRACMAWAWAELRDFRRSIRLADEAHAGLRAIGDGWFFSSTLAFNAYSKAATGDSAGAEEALDELAAIAREIGTAIRSSAALGPGLVAFVEGRWTEAAAHLGSVDGMDLAVSRTQHAIALVLAGEPVSSCGPNESTPWVGRQTALVQAEADLVGGDARSAKDHARDFLLDDTPLVLTPILEVHALQLMAAAAAAIDQHDEAVRLAGAAAGEMARVGISPETMLTTLFTPQIERARDMVGDDRAGTLFDSGAAMGWDEVLAYLKRGRGARRRPRSGWDALTPTERQVIDLVVAGQSNKAIAEKLLMSVPTVKSHLTHAYAKVGVSSRTELMAAEQSNAFR